MSFQAFQWKSGGETVLSQDFKKEVKSIFNNNILQDKTFAPRSDLCSSYGFYDYGNEKSTSIPKPSRLKSPTRELNLHEVHRPCMVRDFLRC
ncbi:hypothetical protein DSW25_04145 [Sulfitobacter donghicola DSW-25 = KCTC 12864 = JCM 14565]|uniref:Uncharacterized protein n=1 Tax=Sulfitobacter donghicola DSW-25 = KCTC 12864 = JCM 14565 TaxID=1300350 RepID=A0A073IET0_9RHOB|nr:hypothetical protein DSW25_04145 [Sulfitobacter donghicola DSW-25 = KCTC 12864 = JCM 14565]